MAIVTGASRRSAIGAAIVRRLAADGLDLLIHHWEPHDAAQPCGPDAGAARALAAEARARGGCADDVSLDLAAPDAPAELVALARELFGGLDVLVANHARSSRQSLGELTVGELDLCFAVNTRATLLMIQAMIASRPERPGGRVVLFTSGQYHDAMPQELPYIASKGALHQLTGTLAVELMPRGVTVNCVDPGPTDTGYADAAGLAALANKIPGGRWGVPDDAARLVRWLVSDDAAWVTGQVIASDGGWSRRSRAG